MQEGVELAERDFFKEPFSEEELRALIGDRPISEVFSWKSPSFRKLGLDPESLTDDRLVELMLEEPRLIRRPMMVIGDELVVGADLRALSKLLAPFRSG